ncbi:MAG: hypothetical protein HWE25_01700 [Alphaproteobacteria bacterium]|nr:hypothetical protein [Alphaproteobacteria bacterium]
MGQTFLDQFSPQEAYAFLILGRLNRSAIMETANTWLDAGIFVEGLGATWYDDEAPYEELVKDFKAALTQLGALPFSQKEAAFYLCFQSLCRGLRGETTLGLATLFVLDLYCEMGREDDVYGAALDAADLLAAYIEYEDSTFSSPQQEGPCLNRLKKAAMAWTERHPDGAVTPVIPAPKSFWQRFGPSD